MSNYSKLTDKEFDKLAVIGIKKECNWCKKTYALKLLPDEAFVLDVAQIEGQQLQKALPFLNDTEREFIINSSCVLCQREIYKETGYINMRRWLVKNNKTGEYERLKGADVISLDEWRRRKIAEKEERDDIF